MYSAVSWQPLVRMVPGASSMAFLCFGFPAEMTCSRWYKRPGQQPGKQQEARTDMA